jgi:hypothetical protein
MGAFADKLDFVLKALSISAGRFGEPLSSNPTLSADDVPGATRRRLGESVGADPAASPLLMMAAMTSLARGGKARLSAEPAGGVGVRGQVLAPRSSRPASHRWKQNENML